MRSVLGHSKGITCVKWTVFAFNLLFFLTGCGLVGIGVWLDVSRGDWEGISDYDYLSIANLVIAAGVVIVVVSFVGCCGAVIENKILLILFFVFLLLICMVEVTAGVLGYIWRDEIDNELLSQLDKRIPERYYMEEGVKVAMNSVQEQFKCCGLYGSTDWSEQIPDMKRYVHESCCIRENNHPDYNANCGTVVYEAIDANPNILKYYYSNGCYNSIKDFMKENFWIVAVVSLVFAGFQVCGMVAAMLLFCRIRRAEQMLY